MLVSAECHVPQMLQCMHGTGDLVQFCEVPVFSCRLPVSCIEQLAEIAGCCPPSATQQATLLAAR
jgi:hypothetical protein